MNPGVRAALNELNSEIETFCAKLDARVARNSISSRANEAALSPTEPQKQIERVRYTPAQVITKPPIVIEKPPFVVPPPLVVSPITIEDLDESYPVYVEAVDVPAKHVPQYPVVTDSLVKVPAPKVGAESRKGFRLLYYVLGGLLVLAVAAVVAFLSKP